MTTGGIVAWLPWRVSCKITEEPGVGLGIWLGSILEGPAIGAPVWPTAGDIVVVIDWFVASLLSTKINKRWNVPCCCFLF